MSQSTLGSGEQFPQVWRAMVCIPTAKVCSSWLFVRAPEACQGIHCWPCKLSSCICLQWHELALLSPPQMEFWNLEPCTLKPRLHLLWNFWSGMLRCLHLSLCLMDMVTSCILVKHETPSSYSFPLNSSFSNILHSGSSSLTKFCLLSIFLVEIKIEGEVWTCRVDRLRHKQ